MNWYLTALKNTGNFSGRARRKEFWYFVLALAILVYGPLLGGAYVGSETLIYAAVVIFLAHIVTLYAVTIRRLHDCNLSGWLVLIKFIPLGIFVLLYLCVQDSFADFNPWGPNPKEMPQ